MAGTYYNLWEKPLSREQNLELFLQQKLDEIDLALGNTLIYGLGLEWVSNTSIKVNPGVAYVGGYGRMRVPTAVTVAGITLGASQWGHVYLYSNAGTPTVEVVTTAPESYLGPAHQKTGDGTRRYLGSVKTDASGNIYKFDHDPVTNYVRYLCNVTASPHRALTAGTATTETTVSLSAVVPATSNKAHGRFANTSNQGFVLGHSGDGVTLSGAAAIASAGAPSDFPDTVALDSARAFTYMLLGAPSSGGLFFDLYGYRFVR